VADRLIRAMVRDDLPQVLALWERTEGVGLRAVDDDLPALQKFLERNAGLSVIAFVQDECAGAMLCGSDGRRGYLHHLAVRSDRRRRGIGRELVEHAITCFRSAGIRKVSIDVFENNSGARDFWRAIGFYDRDDIQRMSFQLTDSA